MSGDHLRTEDAADEDLSPRPDRLRTAPVPDESASGGADPRCWKALWVCLVAGLLTLLDGSATASNRTG